MELSPHLDFKIFVNEDEIYSGDFSEVPEGKRTALRQDLADWAGSLGKRGLNELIYSHLAWYEEKELRCKGCGKENENADADRCASCGGEMAETYVHERNPKLDMIMTCAGMITEVRITRD